MSDSREGMTPEKAREILKNHEALGHFEDIDGHGRANGFLEGIEYARRTAENLQAEYERLQNDNVRLRGVVERLWKLLEMGVYCTCIWNGSAEFPNCPLHKALSESAGVMDGK